MRKNARIGTQEPLLSLNLPLEAKQKMSFIAEKKNISAHDLKNHRFSYFITQPRPYFVCFFDINYFLTLSRILFQCTAANQTFVKKIYFLQNFVKAIS
jgi:hypothetical protein